MKKLFCICSISFVFFLGIRGNAQEVKINHDGTDGLAIEADGTIRLDGIASVFDDMFGDITKVKVKGGGLALNDVENTIDFADNANLADYAIVVYQMSHKWKMGTTIYPHFHWVQESNSVPNFLIQYRWQKNGEAKTTAWTNYKCNTTNAFVYSSGSLNQITHGSGLIPPEGYGISDVIQIRILRDTGNESGVFSGADTYSGTVSISSVDCHIEIDTEGSRSEYEK
ncbi:MAG: hypothetical protein JXR61_11525 [Prolixibacteraceae bacterium]|nr:hypothetical protein [Prolixibacteraceae bacterium]